jgi:alkanesulfonate monooxygenase SsuD/methylene tetrahydromethanopterin reductase-like flavin-dependent oxidoreductase (luciferase family)
VDSLSRPRSPSCTRRSTGALYVGSPETVAQKIAANLPLLGATRFDLKYGMGGLAHQALMTNIELYVTHVIPRVRELLA